MKNILRYIVFVLLLPGTIAASVMAEHDTNMPVQRLDLQAKLLRSVLKFSTRRLEQLRIGIVYQDGEEQLAQEFADELEKLEFNGSPIAWELIPVEALEAADSVVNVFYLTPGLEDFLEQIFEMSRQKKILSCTGIPTYVEEGKVALGFDSYRGNPQIVLNLPLARNVDFDFKNPKFLNLQKTGKLLLIK